MNDNLRVVVEGCIYGDTVIRRGKCAFLLATDEPRLVPCVMTDYDEQTLERMRGGALVKVTGQMRTREYLTKDFRDGTITELLVSSVE